MSERQCSCLEVLGENPSCPFHGIGTDWWARAIHDDPLARAELVERLQEHDRRVTELLEANNREVERRREAEAIVAELAEWHTRSEAPDWADFMNGDADDGRNGNNEITALGERAATLVKRHA